MVTKRLNVPRRVAIWAVALLALAATSTFALASTSSFPGLPWESAPVGREVNTQGASSDGATLRVNAVYGDPVQTTISYAIEGRPSDGTSGSIVPATRLVLRDGTILPLRWNATDPARPGVGTLVFPGLSAADNQVTLEVDGLTFASRAVSARFSVALEIDTREGYAATRSSSDVFHSGSGESAVTITSITRTPNATVVRGTFDGLSEGAIESIGRPDFWVVDSQGKRVQTDSGRLGFGDGLREFELHFPASAEGPAVIEFHGLPGSSDLSSNSIVAIRIP